MDMKVGDIIIKKHDTTVGKIVGWESVDKIINIQDIMYTLESGNVFPKEILERLYKVADIVDADAFAVKAENSIDFQKMRCYNMCKKISEKEADSMTTATMERKSYKRLNIGALKFMSEEQIDEEKMEDVTPIQWVKEVLSGEKQVIIKKQ